MEKEKIKKKENIEDVGFSNLVKNNLCISRANLIKVEKVEAIRICLVEGSGTKKDPLDVVDYIYLVDRDVLVKI